jgi:voltage-gated sodium channel
MLFMTGVHGNTARFDRVALGAILVNTVVLGWSWLDHVHQQAIERIDTCFVVFFLIELVTRLRRAGWRWLRRPWNLFDATIILLALLPVLGDSITILRMARAAKLVHLGRHISHLRAAAWLGRRLNRPTEAAKIVARVPT